MTFSDEHAFALAHDVLTGVGEATLGEWHEVGDIAWHLRRRLSSEEEGAVGPVQDIRGTWEATKRKFAIRRHLPAEVQRTPMEQWP